MGDPNRRMFSPEIEAMPREDIERLQEEKLLGDLVPWAYERSGLIRETWDAAGVKPADIQSLDDFHEKVPFIDKDAIRSYRDRHDDPYGGLLCLDPADPKPFRRRQRSTYVIAVHHMADRPDDVLRAEYPMLVRALANIAMLVVPGDACYFVTPEQGFYSVPDPGDPEAWVKALFDRIEPLATSRLVIDNHFETDLEPENAAVEVLCGLELPDLDGDLVHPGDLEFHRTTGSVQHH